MTDNIVAAYMRVSVLNMYHVLYHANMVLITHYYPVVPVFQLTVVVILVFIQLQNMATLVTHLLLSTFYDN
jgi:hypothetical protein